MPVVPATTITTYMDIGHSPKTPVQEAMNNYFENLNPKKFRGRPINNLPNSIHNDIKLLKNYITKGNKYKFTLLESIDDLKNLVLLTEDRKRWGTYVKTHL